jgi:hypothetical protein
MGVIIDTNVLEHADNTIEQRQLHSIALIDYVRNNPELILYVDESLDKIQSFILTEYDDRLKPGMYGHTLLLLLLGQNRVKPLKRVIRNTTVNRKIRQWVHKTVDIAFARITYNSNEKTLISHDFEDFTTEARDFLNDEIGILVIEASDFNQTH